CQLTVADQDVVDHRVTIVGHNKLPALDAADASALYDRNLLDFMKLLYDKDRTFSINLEHDIVAACLICRDGHLVRK
ncbi:NAD(P)(+) transhydrogenase (Re/Si-specific) subunit alpha, partial [Pseudomonas syringae pv. tagetis]